jgi:hypothetical protein
MHLVVLVADQLLTSGSLTTKALGDMGAFGMDTCGQSHDHLGYRYMSTIMKLQVLNMLECMLLTKAVGVSELPCSLLALTHCN